MNMRYLLSVVVFAVSGPALLGQWAQVGWGRMASGLEQPAQVTGVGRVRILKDGGVAV